MLESAFLESITYFEMEARPSTESNKGEKNLLIPFFKCMFPIVELVDIQNRKKGDHRKDKEAERNTMALVSSKPLCVFGSTAFQFFLPRLFQSCDVVYRVPRAP